MFSSLRHIADLTGKILTRKVTPVQFGDLKRSRPVSPIFGLDRGTSISRYYVDTFIKGSADKIVGDALEVGEFRYLSRFGDRVRKKKILVPRSEVAPSELSTDDIVVADLSVPSSCPENSFDCFVCTQTLQFIFDVHTAVHSAYGLLRPKGMFLGTVSGISQVSRYDMDRWGDYWRFTHLSLKKSLIAAFGDNVSIFSMGNALAAQLLLQGVAVEDLPDPALLEEQDPDYPVILGFVASKAEKMPVHTLCS